MNDKNADVLDQASVVTDLLTTKLIERQRELAKPEKHPDFDGRHCVEEECGESIPDERLGLGKIRCISCQELLEKSRRTTAGPLWS